jgi:peptide/nickel transport system substrate-binding protein
LSSKTASDEVVIQAEQQALALGCLVTLNEVQQAEADHYLGYNNQAFNTLYKQIVTTPDEAGRAKLLGDAQRMLATDAVAGFLFQPQLITITNKKLKGVWKDVPQFENDFSTWSWE